MEIYSQQMKAQLVRTEELHQSDKDAMCSLLFTHFGGVRQEVFDNDLAEKNWVILIEDQASGKLKGFSTLLMFQTKFEGQSLGVVYSGDTIMDPSAWSSSLLSRTWIASVNKLRQEHLLPRLYWLLISSGYRTYRFLPTFWKEFYPRYDASTPPQTEALMKFLARDRFGKFYDEAAGVVRFPHPHVLRAGLRGIPEERLQDPHINFFDSKNPGHLQGDELVCFTEICEENLTSAGRRMWFANRSLAISH